MKVVLGHLGSAIGMAAGLLIAVFGAYAFVHIMRSPRISVDGVLVLILLAVVAVLGVLLVVANVLRFYAAVARRPQ